MVLGLTGGLGCGKSTTAKLFAERGYRHIDTDLIVREQVLPTSDVMSALWNRFGDRIFAPEGHVNRVALANIVFEDDSERAWLEDLTHPPLFEIMRSTMKGAPGVNWVVEVPLLYEKALENWFDYTVCVACDPSLQLARLEQRGMDRSLAGKRISKQLPLARKIELSDFVLWNDGSTSFLKEQVDRIVESLEHTRAVATL